MTKHTPGPWALDDESIYAPDGEGWKQVAEIPNWRTNPGEVLTPEDNANARLIAAAPKMLAALEKAAEFIRDQYEGLDPLTGGFLADVAEPIWAILSEAIAEARSGESDAA